MELRQKKTEHVRPPTYYGTHIIQAGLSCRLQASQAGHLGLDLLHTGAQQLQVLHMQLHRLVQCQVRLRGNAVCFVILPCLPFQFSHN